MVALLNKNVIELEKRQGDCFKSAVRKIENILDHTKINRQADNQLKVTSVLNSINKLKKKHKIAVETKMQIRNKDYYYIECEFPEVFAKGIKDALFPVCEDILCQELKDFEGNIKQYLKYANERERQRLNNNIRELVGYAEMSKNQEMEQELFQIEQDLLSCMKYNDKIKKEAKLG